MIIQEDILAGYRMDGCSIGMVTVSSLLKSPRADQQNLRVKHVLQEVHVMQGQPGERDKLVQQNLQENQHGLILAMNPFSSHKKKFSRPMCESMRNFLYEIGESLIRTAKMWNREASVCNVSQRYEEVGNLVGSDF